MPGKIFINYRRTDDAGSVRSIHGQLEKVFSADQLFFDVEDGIPAGHDFVQVLKTQIVQCDVMLAMIGRHWLTETDQTGARRLDNPDDFVRVEIELALNQRKLVIP